MSYFERRKTQRELAELKQFDANNRKLFLQEEFSNLPQAGHLAIFMSTATSGPQRRQYYIQDINDRDSKARQILAAGKQTHESAEIILDPTKREVFDYLRDKLVSSMIFIAPGTATHAKLNSTELVNWQEMAKKTKHLKTGNIDQFMYGLHPIQGDYCIPLGTFSVCNPENVLVATNLGGPPQEEVENMGVVPPYTQRCGLLSQIVQYSEALPTMHRTA